MISFGYRVVLLPLLLLLSISAQGQELNEENDIDDEFAYVDKVLGVLIVPTIDDVKVEGVDFRLEGVSIEGPDFLRDPVLIDQISDIVLGKRLTDEKLNELLKAIVVFCRDQNHLVVDAFFREQVIKHGVIQIALLEATIGDINVENDGARHFSDAVIRRHLRLKKGDWVDGKVLSEDLLWLNRNSYQSLGQFSAPFRQVSAAFKQGKLGGETDLSIVVKDRFPLRAFVGYEDTGFTVIGQHRNFAGFDWANVFGQDHRLNYRYTTDSAYQLYRGHMASYVIPIPKWRHRLVFFGGHSTISPDFAELDPVNLGGLVGDGSIYQVGARYSVPLRRGKKYEDDLTVGFDFKKTDTPLFFGTASSGLLRTNQLEVANLLVDYSGLLRDELGGTSWTLQGVYSPGNLTSRNTDSSFSDFSPGSDARYLYGQLRLARETQISSTNLTWKIQGMGQISDSQLAPSETFGVGGYATVRGYDERTVVGDHGWYVSNELRSRLFSLGKNPKDAGVLQLLTFIDYGMVYTRSPSAALDEQYNEALASVGVGLRYQLANTARLRFDYGYQLKRGYHRDTLLPGERQGRSRVHVGVEISF